MNSYDRKLDRIIGHDYPGTHHQGLHDFIMDELELGARVAMAFDDPTQTWWEIEGRVLYAEGNIE